MIKPTDRKKKADLKKQTADLKKQVSEAIAACQDKKAEEITILEMEAGSEHLPITSWCVTAPTPSRFNRLPTK